MRPIKFRAWNKKYKKMLTIESINWDPENEWVAFKEDLRVPGDIINDTQDYEIHNGCELDDVELLQYTGLKDKNGNEIWEGDVLFNRKVTMKFGKWLLCNEFDRENLDLYSALSDSPAEIQGNIFENSKLAEILKVSQEKIYTFEELCQMPKEIKCSTN